MICIRCGCPRPVCNLCALPNFGYFQACWTPWPLPPDWSHCPVPPPAALVHLGPPAPPALGLNRMPTSPLGPLVPDNGPGVNPPGSDQESFPPPRPLVPPPGGAKPELVPDR